MDSTLITHDERRAFGVPARDRIQALRPLMPDLRGAIISARNALESYGIAPHPASHLSAFCEHLEQIRGVLHFLELGGAQLLAEDMVGAANALAEKSEGFKPEEYEVLIKAIFSLETYLDQTSDGRAIAPLVLLPLLNELRAVQQLPLISEMALFSPDLSWRPEITASGKHSAQTMARRLRPYYQSGLLRWYNDPGDDRGLLQLTTIIHRMERASRNAVSHQLWWIARGLIDAVLNNTVELSVAIRVLFGKLDRILKIVRDIGEEALERRPPHDIMKNMLYYIAMAPAVSVRVRDIKQKYDLDRLLPDADRLKSALSQLGGPLQALPEVISTALKDELARVKVVLDSYAYGERRDQALLADAADILKASADTMTLLGLRDTQVVLLSNAQTLRDRVARGETLLEADLVHIAEQLLTVENTLNNLREILLAQPEYALSASGSIEDTTAMNNPALGTAPGKELLKIRAHAIRLCVNNVSSTMQRMLVYVGAPTVQNFPAEILVMLREVEGGLTMLESLDGARLCHSLAMHIESKIVDSRVVPQPEFLDVLAEAIMSFSLYLESLQENDGDHAGAFAMASEAEAAIHKTASFRPAAVVVVSEDDQADEEARQVADAIRAQDELDDLEIPAEAIDEEVIEIFLDEADEQIAVMRDIVRAFKEQGPSSEFLQLLQRLSHTLKGSANIVQASKAAEVADLIERLADAALNEHLTFSDQVAALLDALVETQNQAISAFRYRQTDIGIDNELLRRARKTLENDVFRGTTESTRSPNEKGRAADLLTSFVVEVGASLSNVRRFIDDCGATPGGCRVTDSLVHTVKSITTNSATLDLAEIAQLSGLLESFLAGLKDAHASVDGHTLTLLREFCTAVDGLVASLRGQVSRPVDTRNLQRALSALPSQVDRANDITAREESAEDKQTLLEIFLDESQKLLEGVGRIVGLLDDERRRSEGVAELLRVIHTIKGGARVAGIKPIGDLAHALESLLETVTDSQTPLSSGFRGGMTKALDSLSDMVDALSRGETVHGDSRLLVTLSVLQSEQRTKIKAPRIDTAAVSTHTESQTSSKEVEYSFDNQSSLADAALIEDARRKTEPLRVNAEDIDQLVNYAGEGNVLLSRLESQMEGYKDLLNEFDRLLQRLRAHTREIEAIGEGGALVSSESPKSDSAVDLHHFTEQQQVVGELTGSIGELAMLQSGFIKLFHETNSAVIQQAKVHHVLHEGLLSARMVQFGRQAQRLQRLVRQTAEDVHKNARLELEGMEGKLDRVLLDRLLGPLEHILSNAIAHGIEDEHIRLAMGKPAQGTVKVSLYKEGEKNILEIKDDGAGVDVNAVRAKALDKGIIRPDQNLSDEELVYLILEPGFSTAKEVTQIAGRGVGLDAANREILQVGGSLQVHSRKGMGTVFTIELPFTMAMHQVILVRHGDQIYALPNAHIDHIERNVGADLLERLSQANNPTFAFNGQSYHFWRLGELINDSSAKRIVREQPLILVTHGDYHAALLVDEVFGSREIFVRPAGPQAHSNPYVAGATVLGDGRVALLLDVAKLFKSSPLRGEGDGESKGQFLSEDMLKVLVVDDSVTVRKVTERFLARHQMNVSTAKDGIEALQKLEEKHPDIVLLDIEMPRMDGFEFTKRIRHDQRWQGLPIIMISSRNSPKHVSHAEELGVNLFLGKPYQESELLDHIYRLTTHETVEG